MKRTVRVMTSCLVSALLACTVLLAGCGQLAPSEAETRAVPQAVDDSALITPGTLTVGLDYSYAPFAGKSSGEVVGIDADVAAALADAMGLKVAFVDISADGGPNTLANKKCDIFLNYDKTLSEKETADYLGTYIYDAPSIFAIGTSDPVPALASDMTAKKIAVQKDSVSAVAVASKYGSNVLDSQSSLVDAFGELESGSADYVAASGVVGKYIATSYDDIVWVSALTQATEIGIGGTASNTVLSDGVKHALSDISGNGILTLIVSKWIGSPLTFDSATQSADTSTTTTTTTTTTTADGAAATATADTAAASATTSS